MDCTKKGRLAVDIQEQGVLRRKVTTDGHPHTGIAKYGETNQVGLIVISTRGHLDLSRWLRGSVAEHVVLGAMVLVLLVRARKEES